MKLQRWVKNFIFFLTYSTILVLCLVWIFRSIVDWKVVFYLKDPMNIVIILSSIGVVILFSLSVSFLNFLFLKQANDVLAQQIEWLSVGKYQHAIFSKKIFAEEWLPYNFQLQRQMILQLRDKLMTISSELQWYSAQPSYIDGETKEDILVQERHRIARELHDSVSQQLFAAMMMLSALNEQIDEENQPFAKQLQMVEKIINESQSEMRALLLHLRPTSLENKSLKEGITGLLKELATKVQMEIFWDLDDARIAPEIEDHLFRIVQELLSNTLRHAKASKVDVYLKQNAEQLSLRVIDDGVGFDVEQSKPGSYGLMHIRERVVGMGGTLKIVSFPNRGAIVEIRIPNTIKIKNETMRGGDE